MTTVKVGAKPRDKKTRRLGRSSPMDMEDQAVDKPACTSVYLLINPPIPSYTPYIWWQNSPAMVSNWLWWQVDRPFASDSGEIFQTLTRHRRYHAMHSAWFLGDGMLWVSRNRRRLSFTQWGFIVRLTIALASKNKQHLVGFITGAPGIKPTNRQPMLSHNSWVVTWSTHEFWCANDEACCHQWWSRRRSVDICCGINMYNCITIEDCCMTTYIYIYI